MAKTVTCDRCGTATEQTAYRHGLRASVTIKHLSRAATANTRRELDLCESCTEALHSWLGRQLPVKFRDEKGYGEIGE